MTDIPTSPAGVVAAALSPASSLGSRLRTGREALQLSVADVANKLRVSHAIVEAIERDDLQRLGAPVYARGYLNSYAKLVDLPLVVVDSALQRVVEPMVPLHSAIHTSRGRFLVDRYARRAASIVLTASIVVPVVWLATEERLPVQPLALRSLDPPAVTSMGSATADSSRATVRDDAFVSADPSAGKVGLQPSTFHDEPIVASFAPFLGSRAASPTENDAAVAGWKLVFRGDSWVEIVDHRGRRLEYGVISGGSERVYAAGDIARVSLGNASVVTVERDGQSFSLVPFQRANVARFAVSSGGELTPAGG